MSSETHEFREVEGEEDGEDADMNADEEEDEEEDEEQDEESESEEKEEEKEPCVLDAILMRAIFREYAGSGRVGIERSEIVSLLKSKVDNPITKYDTLSNNMRFNISINQAIIGACHAPVYALYRPHGEPNQFNAYVGMVREVKVLPNKTRDERFKAQLINDVDYVALADYLGVFVECSYEEEHEANEKFMKEYLLKNAHKFAVVGYPRSNVDTFDNERYPQCDQQSRVIKVINE